MLGVGAQLLVSTDASCPETEERVTQKYLLLLHFRYLVWNDERSRVLTVYDEKWNC